MSYKQTRLVEEFQAVSDDGESYEVSVYQEFIDASSMGNPNQWIWALGLVVFEWTALENELDLWTYIANGSVVPDKDGPRLGFKRRAHLLKEIVRRDVQEPHKSNFVSIIDRVLGVQAERDKLVHWLWGDSEGGIGVADWRSHFKTPDWNFDFKRLVAVSQKIDGLRNELIQIALQNGEKDGVIFQSNAWHRICGKA